MNVVDAIPAPLARAIREAAGMSQARLAAELGVTQVAVSRYERGRSRPRGDLATRYYALLREVQEALA